MNNALVKRALLAFAVAAGLVAGEARAVLLAADNASNAPYAGGWQSGDNGGSGLGAWTLTTGGTRLYSVGDSTSNADTIDNGTTGGALLADGDINTSGNVAWGMTASAGETATAVRDINTALSIGGTLSLDMDNGHISIGNQGIVGIDLQNQNGETMFEFFFVGGTSFYQWADEGGTNTSTIAYTDEGLTLTLTRTGLDSYSTTILTRGGVTQIITGDFGGASDPSALNRLRLFNAYAGLGPEATAYFNSFTMNGVDVLVPEPATALLLLTGLSLVFARRRPAVTASAGSPATGPK